jgi:hypothetical protein
VTFTETDARLSILLPNVGKTWFVVNQSETIQDLLTSINNEMNEGDEVSPTFYDQDWN